MTETNGVANRESFFSGPAMQRRYRTVDVPLIGPVEIRSLTELESSRHHAAFMNEAGEFDTAKAETIKLQLIILMAVDGMRLQLFTEADIDRLKELDAMATQVLYNACMEHAGFSGDTVEDLAKNSEEIPAECLP